jgi:alanine dehydrogenase
MIIGIPKEIKNWENRVSLTPSGAKTFIDNGHTLFVQSGAGLGSGFLDEEYSNIGAKIISTIEEVYQKSDMIIKVKEPQESEYELLKEGQLLFTYLHLAVAPELTKILLKHKVTGIAYETIQTAKGELPLLTPMSEIAGKMAVQIGATYLEKPHGGRGVLLGGVPGVMPADVVIIGGGTVGLNAAKIAYGMGANVTVIDLNLNRLRYFDDIFNGKIKTLISSSYNLELCTSYADLLIGAVLIPGAKAPHLISEEMVKTMKKGAVIVDVAIDQGGIIETIDRVTTHENPVFEKHGVMHYSVANIPGAVPRTATLALTNATLPYALNLANKGFIKAIKSCEELAKGVNTCQGQLVSKPVAESLGLKHTELSMLIGF